MTDDAGEGDRRYDKNKPSSYIKINKKTFVVSILVISIISGLMLSSSILNLHLISYADSGSNDSSKRKSSDKGIAGNNGEQASQQGSSTPVQNILNGPQDGGSNTPTRDCGRLTQCGSSCVNIYKSHNNCGACGNICPTDADCIQGGCRKRITPQPPPVCRSGEGACTERGEYGLGLVCRDLRNDISNCGACGHACSSGLVCNSGTCCPSGQALCGGTCTSLNSDVHNCGVCGHACTADHVCLDGGCIATHPCPSGREYYNGHCEQICISPAHRACVAIRGCYCACPINGFENGHGGCNPMPSPPTPPVPTTSGTPTAQPMCFVLHHDSDTGLHYCRHIDTSLYSSEQQARDAISHSTDYNEHDTIDRLCDCNNSANACATFEAGETPPSGLICNEH